MRSLLLERKITIFKFYIYLKLMTENVFIAILGLQGHKRMGKTCAYKMLCFLRHPTAHAWVGHSFQFYGPLVTESEPTLQVEVSLVLTEVHFFSIFWYLGGFVFLQISYSQADLSSIITGSSITDFLFQECLSLISRFLTGVYFLQIF